jgi:predicted kinase
VATLHVLVGLPGAGKTTLAKRLEAEHDALRFTPDDWFVRLDLTDPDGRRRDSMEGLMLRLALRCLELGVDAVVDFGVWSRDERACLRDLARRRGADSRLYYLPVEPEESWRRVTARQDAAVLGIERADLTRWATLFETPSAEELDGRDARPDDPDWAEWSQRRWHTLAE